MGLFKQVSNFKEIGIQYMAGYCCRFILAKSIVDGSMYILDLVIAIGLQVNKEILLSVGNGSLNTVEYLPKEVVDSITNVGFFDSIPLWLVSLIIWLVLCVCGILFLVVVGTRFFKVYMHIALAPLALSTFGSELTSQTGKHFLKSFAGVSLEAAAILTAMVIANALASTLTGGISLVSGAGAVVMVWNYMIKLVISMVLLVFTAFGAQRLVHGIFGT